MASVAAQRVPAPRLSLSPLFAPEDAPWSRGPAVFSRGDSTAACHSFTARSRTLRTQHARKRKELLLENNLEPGAGGRRRRRRGVSRREAGRAQAALPSHRAASVVVVVFVVEMWPVGVGRGHGGFVRVQSGSRSICRRCVILRFVVSSFVT